MTRPAPHRRSTRQEREERRLQFQALKAAVADSPAALAYAEKNRMDNRIGRAREKIRRTGRVMPLTALQVYALRPSDILGLRERAIERLAPLTAEQRARLHENLLQLFVPLLTDDAFAAYVAWPQQSQMTDYADFQRAELEGELAGATAITRPSRS
jgi:hypothetical protein